jgi:large subunit ribosomal protein L19
MHKKLIEFNKAVRASKKMPELKAGDVVKVHLKIKEGEKERTQIFEGLIIAIKGKQSSSPTITVRKISHGVGVEMILPLHSHNVQKIVPVKRAKVRRAKLYYVRGLTAKKSKMKYKELSEFIAEEPKEVKEDLTEESKEGSEKTEKIEKKEVKKEEKK